ncbi:response regulator receiver protein [Rubellimicrobium thermophilum DSM 16684]|uniref:Response regulator receiver protein n=2 Tax=Rubellimicrobium thermophilum DSM 16684 TaxID=1123069 RepID=S9QU65_9RHOB|nr:response regulator [Rubellimicrobium thermophilum]EPX83127.1 response regulator receiver protein [Rubellimicrobium thermophilum DSM 16684]
MPQTFADAVAASLPHLRRYARALTGEQRTGDAIAARTLEGLIADPSVLERDLEPRLMLFRAFHRTWRREGAPVGEADSHLAQRAQSHLARLTPNTREALLLHAIEGFTAQEIGAVMEVPPETAADFIDTALREMAESVAGRVMIIEDEAIIAMDIAAIVREMGHRVTGIARTRFEAVRLAREERPDLILADIQLADNSSGIDAVNEILAEFADLPVIFITAFPERLLTGERPEPAFLITKPYREEQVRSAVSQAMFFASTETLAA